MTPFFPYLFVEGPSCSSPPMRPFLKRGVFLLKTSPRSHRFPPLHPPRPLLSFGPSALNTPLSFREPAVPPPPLAIFPPPSARRPSLSFERFIEVFFLENTRFPRDLVSEISSFGRVPLVSFFFPSRLLLHSHAFRPEWFPLLEDEDPR